MLSPCQLGLSPWHRRYLRDPHEAVLTLPPLQDGTGPINIGLRILQTFLPFINLCIYIAIASFQKKWAVGPSFLTALALFFNAQSLIHGGIFRECSLVATRERRERSLTAMCPDAVATPLLADRLKLLRSVARLLRQVRVGVIINATQVVLMLLIAYVPAVSPPLSD